MLPDPNSIDITAIATVTVLIVLHITDIATDVGIMGMTMFTVAKLVVIEAVAVWTKRRDSQMFQR